MKPMRIVVITVATLMSGSAYADDTPVLATAAYVQDAYRQAMAQVLTRQEKLPMASRPTSGRYNVVWDGDVGQFVFNVDGESGLICGPGGYIDGNVCSFCDKGLFDTTQTESVTNGARSRSDTCTSVNASGMTCECSDHIYGDWNYACNDGYIFDGVGCVNDLQCDAFSGMYNIGFDQCVSKSTNGTTNSGYDSQEWLWFTTFDYGRISGEATCLSATEGLGRTSTEGSYYGTGEYSSTFIDTVKGLQGKDANGESRQYCWCKMTYPKVSR